MRLRPRANEIALAAVVLMFGASLAALAGCQARPALPPLVRIEAHEYSFEMPKSIPAGLTRIRIVNRGTQWHESLVMSFSDSNASAARYLLAYRTEDFPSFARDLGGPGLTMPGDSGEVWLDLAPGPHAVMCFFSDHLEAHGMAADFMVTPANGPTAPRPRADVELHFRDHAYSFSRSLRRGSQLVHIVNDGPQPHEGDLIRLDPGKSFDDFRKWAHAKYAGPAPGRAGGGTGDLFAGREMWLAVTLAPGNYVMYCTVPDAKDGRSHYDHGMTHAFRIE